MIELLEPTNKITMKDLTAKINELIEASNAAPAARDRGPKSDRAMTEDDAVRVISGDLKDASHKSAAEQLNLSYGQIYSARKCFTFKKVNQDARKAASDAAE